MKKIIGWLLIAGLVSLSVSLLGRAEPVRAYEERTATIHAYDLYTFVIRFPGSEGCDRQPDLSPPRPGTILTGRVEPCFAYQGIARFDLAPLRQERGPVVTHAEVRFEEFRYNPAPCLYFTGVAVEEPTGRDRFDDVLYESYESARVVPTAFRGWDVTYWAERWLVAPDENFGLVVIAAAPQGSLDCVAELSNIRLDLTYVVASPPPPTRTLNPIEQAARGGFEATESIAAAQRADLVVTNVYTNKYDPNQPLNCDPGANTFVAVIKNQGRTDAGPFSVDLLLGGNANPAFLTRAVGGLASGQETSVEFPPTLLGPGAQPVRVTVDSTAAIVEVDDTNNYREARCTV